jgi:hypothetical protein
MSPRSRHIPDGASLTSIKLTAEDKTAIHWIKLARRARGDDRDRLNDILVDSLWYLLEKVEGKTREDIRAMIPVAQQPVPVPHKVTEMPKSGRNR